MNEQKKPSTLYANYDFWIGDWDVSWKEKNGDKGKGRNTITKILNGNALQEKFIVTDGAGIGFKGQSISYIEKSTNQWKQLWVDNRGISYEFFGDFQNGDPKFCTKSIERNGKTIFYRMVFKNISENTLIWDWEKSIENQQSWELIWRINYNRIEL
ncbi:hypothetical protein [Flagellimonas flava]|uniref:hypothetical protein n=1 Tax=Flagellimonas flava TaxID=570519 RepID=UPI0010425090|nr:hypothetical protein [Allomuricauda flava]